MRRGPSGSASWLGGDERLLPVDEVGDLRDERVVLDAVRLALGLLEHVDRTLVVAGVGRGLRGLEVGGDVARELLDTVRAVGEVGDDPLDLVEGDAVAAARDLAGRPLDA